LRTKDELIRRMNEIGVSRRVCLGKCRVSKREMSETIDEEQNKISFVLVSKDNAGERFDWWEGEVYIEELDINGANFEGLRTFFKDHRPSVDNAIGRVDATRVENGEIKADVFFGSDDDAMSVFRKYKEKILTDVSIGYIVNDIVVTEKKGEPNHVLVTDYEIVELSAVWKGFDAGAGARSRNYESSAKEKVADLSVWEKRLRLKGMDND